jgi:DNA-binding CsgD family transcriptional regulator
MSRDALSDELLFGLIEQIYDAAVEPHRWKRFVENFARAYRGGAMLFSQDYRGTESVIAEGFGLDPAFAGNYAAHYLGINPYKPIIDATPLGKLIIGHRVLSREAWYGSEFYNDWMRPQDLDHSTGSVLEKAGSVGTGLCFMRATEQGPSTLEEDRFFLRLVPHLQRALKVHHELVWARVERDGALQGLEGLKTAVMIVDRNRHLLFANPIAARMLGRGDGILIRRSQLCGRANSITKSLESIVLRAIIGGSPEGRAGSTLSIPRAEGDPLTLLAIPLKIEGGVIGLGNPAAIIFVTEQSGIERPKAAVLASIYGLTGAEAKLLCALIEGQRLAEYAERAGITINTAATQLKKLFAKTGQNRQADLIRHVLGNPIVRLASVS